MTRNALALLASLGMACALEGCAVTVVDPGSSSSGAGGATGTRSTSSSNGAGAGGGPPYPSCVSPDADTCTCDEGDLRIACSSKNDKLECVCSYGTDFSGICFETDASKLCNFEQGCCANYFSGQ